MNISYKWLKEYVDFELTPQEVCDALTSCGLEVDALEEVQTIKGGLKGLYVGKVLTCEPHPNSDHLHVTTVDLGKDSPSQIVCGAPNVAAGQKVIVADMGCVLYDGDKEFVIKKSKLRGVESQGMICAEDEIGIGTDHAGIIVLPEDAPVGQPAAEYYHLESDWLIEIDITANRADALSHWGVARDLYAWLVQNGYNTSLHRPDCSAFSVDNHELPIEVEIENTDACLRYSCVSIKGCHVKESPAWLQDKLRIIGLRPVNNIVDITNYIMMAYGQPMHCFDADMVEGHRIVVRTQPEGTRFVTLDGQEHILGPHDLSICNAAEPMCIAGIFGGKGSGTYETTTDVVLESACFHPTWIRKSARRHGLSTDSSYRFERGTDPSATIYALKQAAILCKELAGGTVSMDICDKWPQPVNGYPVRLEYAYLDKLIGKHLPEETVKSIVSSLEMQITAADGNGLDLLVPLYRVDVRRPCDVAEDILRIYGYNNIEIPTQLKSSLTTPGKADRHHKLQNLVAEQLVGSGFNEIMNNSLTRTAYYTELNTYTEETTVKLVNPLSADLGAMRQTLLFGGLESIQRNANRKNPNLRLFEFGNCYHYNPQAKNDENPVKAYSEEAHLGLWVSGKHIEGSWTHADQPTSFYHLKAHVQNILTRMGLTDAMLQTVEGENNVFSASLVVKTRTGQTIAQLGPVATALLKQAGINTSVWFADISWDAALKAAERTRVQFHTPAKYPPVSRDLALLIDQSTPFSSIEAIARQTERKLLRSVELFDVYEGPHLPQGKKSYAVNFILQDENATLTDKQIDNCMARLIDNLKKKLGAELR